MQDHKLKIMIDIHIEWVLIEQMKSKENPREAESALRICAKQSLKTLRSWHSEAVTQKLCVRTPEARV